MLTSFPLQILPALHVVEGIFLGPSRPMTWDKHIKNLFRIVFVGLLAGISIAGATSLDHFVSFVGAVCGLPLAFIFPAVCHSKLVAAPGSFAYVIDVAVAIFGFAVTVVIGYHSLATWGS